jgi:hypothetical protein
MPMSTSRAAFYAQQYFPTKYYRDLYEITLEEAKDTQEAREELLKLQIEADKTLQDLAETYRPPRGLTPSERRQLTEAELRVAEENRNNEAARKNRRAFAANPSGPALNEIRLAFDALKDAKKTDLTDAEKKEIIDSATRKALKDVPDAIKRQIFVAIDDKYGSKPSTKPSLSILQDATKTSGLTFDGVREQAASPEDAKARETFAAGGGGKLSPQAEEDQLMIDAQKSAYMDGSLENLGHVASGLTKDQDEILRLYLERLQDKESPGVVTPEEIKAEPRLAGGEAIWNEVAAAGSGLKTSAKFFQLDFLQALQTRDQIVKRIEKDPFEGLSPQEWAAREAFDRGGYTAEEVHYLDALANNPKRAELVRPAYKRAREGLEPKTELEKVIAAAYEMNPDLSVDEIESYVDKIQRLQRKGGRIVARAEGGEQGKATRKAARESAQGIETDDLQAAQAYLVALKLPPNQVAPGIAAPPPAKRPELPADKADAAVDRAAEEAEAPPPPTPSGATLSSEERDQASGDLEGAMFSGTTGTVIEDEVDKTFTDRTPMMQNLKAQQERLKARQQAAAPLTDWEKSEGAIVPDPTGPGFSYTRRGGKLFSIPDGVGGIPVEVPVGTRAYAAIESALKTGKVPAAPKAARPAAPPVAPATPKAPTAAVAPPVAAPAPVAAPVVVPAPAPAPAPKAIEDMTDEELQALIGG